jgi:RimJ/RimL family protein N-acetyltransferase
LKANQPLQLLELQIAALFITDSQGRLRYNQEPGYQEAELDLAPRVFMGRTQAGNIWRFRFDLPQSLVQELVELCRAEPPLDLEQLGEPPQTSARIRAMLQTHAPITQEWHGPAYFISEKSNSISSSSSKRIVQIREENASVLQANFSWKLKRASGNQSGPCVAAVEEGQAVSICYCARLTREAAEAGVETVAAARRRGYGSGVVAEWAAAVRQAGLVPLYSTSWDNLASRGVAHKLGMEFYAEDWSLY